MGKIIKISFLTGVALLILLLHVEYLTVEKKLNVMEKRMYHQFPELSLDKLHEFPKKFDLHFGDTFGFKVQLLSLNGRIKRMLFRDDVAPYVLYGKDDWLFFADKRTLENITGANLFTGKKLKAYHKRLNWKAKVLKNRDLKMYKTYFPDIYEIYPEKLPDRINYLDRDTIYRRVQIEEKFFKKGRFKNIRYINVADELQKAKGEDLLYFTQDLHWNEHGAYTAYQKMINDISKDFPEIKPYKKADFEIKWAQSLDELNAPDLEKWCDNCFDYDEGKKYYYSLAVKYLAVAGKDHFSPVPVYKFRDEIGHNQTEMLSDKKAGLLSLESHFKNLNAQTDLTLALFGDSFSKPLCKFLTLHFENVYYERVPFNKKSINKSKPDLVLEAFIGSGMGINH